MGTAKMNRYPLALLVLFFAAAVSAKRNVQPLGDAWVEAGADFNAAHIIGHNELPKSLGITFGFSLSKTVDPGDTITVNGLNSGKASTGFDMTEPCGWVNGMCVPSGPTNCPDSTTWNATRFGGYGNNPGITFTLTSGSVPVGYACSITVQNGITATQPKSVVYTPGGSTTMSGGAVTMEWD